MNVQNEGKVHAQRLFLFSFHEWPLVLCAVSLSSVLLMCVIEVTLSLVWLRVLTPLASHTQTHT